MTEDEVFREAWRAQVQQFAEEMNRQILVDLKMAMGSGTSYRGNGYTEDEQEEVNVWLED